MIRVRIRKIIRAKRWKVLRAIRQIYRHAEGMPNVKHCEVLEKGRGWAVTSWLVDIDGMTLKWKEKDEVDASNSSVKFHALEGDLAQFEGVLFLRDVEGGGTEVAVEAHARLGLPSLEEVIEDTIAVKLRQNFEWMLDALTDRLHKRQYQHIGDRDTSLLKGFAVIGHPYNLGHLIRYLRFFNPDFKIPSEGFLRSVFEMVPSHKAFTIERFRSKTLREVSGYFILCPIIPDNVLMNPEHVFQKVIQACKVAEDLGAGIATLGGFTSIAGEKYGDQLTQKVHIPVTTGNTFTVAMAIDGVMKAADLLGCELAKTKAAVIGGTGDIGGACARVLSREVGRLTVTGRSEKSLESAKKSLNRLGKAEIKTTNNNNAAVRDADIVIAAASSVGAIVDIKNFKQGAIVCDVGYPKNISYSARERDDILIFSGGLCSTPSDFPIPFDLGLPAKRVLYGCFAEAIILDLEEVYENFSWGRGKIMPEKVDLIRDMGRKHGFEAAPFFWGHKEINEEDIAQLVKAKVS